MSQIDWVNSVSNGPLMGSPSIPSDAFELIHAATDPISGTVDTRWLAATLNSMGDFRAASEGYAQIEAELSQRSPFTASQFSRDVVDTFASHQSGAELRQSATSTPATLDAGNLAIPQGLAQLLEHRGIMLAPHVSDDTAAPTVAAAKPDATAVGHDTATAANAYEQWRPGLISNPTRHNGLADSTLIYPAQAAAIATGAPTAASRSVSRGSGNQAGLDSRFRASIQQTALAQVAEAPDANEYHYALDASSATQRPQVVGIPSPYAYDPSRLGANLGTISGSHSTIDYGYVTAQPTQAPTYESNGTNLAPLFGGIGQYNPLHAGVQTLEFGINGGLLGQSAIGIFAISRGTLAARGLTAADFGARASLKALEGTLKVESGVATVSVRNIEGNLGHYMEALNALKGTARAAGASSLRLEGTVADPMLMRALERLLGPAVRGVPGGPQDIWTIPLGP